MTKELMRTHYIFEKKFENGALIPHKITVFRVNKESPKWMGKFKVNGRMTKPIDLETRDLELAKYIATSKFNDIYAHSKAGTLTPELMKGIEQTSKKSRSIESLSAQVELWCMKKGKSRGTFKSYLEHLNKRVVPIIGQLDINDLVRGDCLTSIYMKHDEVYRYKNNLSKLKSGLNIVQEIAKDKGYITQTTILPNPSYKHDYVTNYEPFNEDDIDQIIDHIPTLASDKKTNDRARRNKSLLQRRLAVPLMLFIKETGLRGVGQELAGIKFKHLKFRDESYFDSEKIHETRVKEERLRVKRIKDLIGLDHKQYFESIKDITSKFNKRATIHIEKGKTSIYKERTIHLSYPALEYLELIIEIRASMGSLKSGPEDYIFGDGVGWFIKLFKDHIIDPLYEDGKITQTYSSYSCRTSFIQHKVKAGNNIFEIAKYCGTSVKTIQDSYLRLFEDDAASQRIADS